MYLNPAAVFVDIQHAGFIAGFNAGAYPGGTGQHSDTDNARAAGLAALHTLDRAEEALRNQRSDLDELRAQVRALEVALRDAEEGGDHEA